MQAIENQIWWRSRWRKHLFCLAGTLARHWDWLALENYTANNNNKHSAQAFAPVHWFLNDPASTAVKFSSWIWREGQNPKPHTKPKIHKPEETPKRRGACLGYPAISIWVRFNKSGLFVQNLATRTTFFLQWNRKHLTRRYPIHDARTSGKFLGMFKI